MITVVVIGVLAVVRRGAGRWWKLVLAGAMTIALAQLVNVAGNLFINQLGQGYRLYWVSSVPTVLLNVIGMALLGVGALSGRRTRATTR